MRLGAVEAGGTKFVCAIGNEFGEKQLSNHDSSRNIGAGNNLFTPKEPRCDWNRIVWTD